MTIAICDDDPAVCDYLTACIREYDALHGIGPHMKILCFPRGGDFLKNPHADILFTDIYMEDLSGIDMLQSIPPRFRPRYVIVISTSREFAIDAFGRKPVYVDRGIRRRAILALGRADVGELESLIPREAGLTVIGGSSDHCIVDVEDCPRRLEVGDIVEFSLCYSHLLYATSRSDVTIQFVN